MPDNGPHGEREWLEGLRYEDKFPDNAFCPRCGGEGECPRKDCVEEGPVPPFDTDAYRAHLKRATTPVIGPDPYSTRGRAHIERTIIAGVLRDWIHETPMSECGIGSDTCEDWTLAYAVADKIIDALNA